MTNLVADLCASSYLYLATQTAHLAMGVLVFQDAGACIAHTLLWIARPLPLPSPPHPSVLHSPTDPLAESVGAHLLKMLLLGFQATIFAPLFLFKEKAHANVCNSLLLSSLASHSDLTTRYTLWRCILPKAGYRSLIQMFIITTKVKQKRVQSICSHS